MVMLRNTHPVCNRKGLLLREKRCTGIPLLFRIVPVLMIARKRYVNLPLLKLRLLQTEDVSIELLKRLRKAVFHRGPKTVYIPRNEFFQIFPFSLIGKQNL